MYKRQTQCGNSSRGFDTPVAYPLNKTVATQRTCVNDRCSDGHIFSRFSGLPVSNDKTTATLQTRTKLDPNVFEFQQSTRGELVSHTSGEVIQFSSSEFLKVNINGRKCKVSSFQSNSIQDDVTSSSRLLDSISCVVS